MRHYRRAPSPALVVSLVALFVAFSGGAAAYASGLIPGSRIENHSIPAKKLTKSAILSLRGQTGAAGAVGPAGPTGPAGPQGPGGTIVAYDATASASPTLTTVGTFLGVTLQAKCWIPSAGEAELDVYVTTAGEWDADDTEFAEADLGTTSTFVSKFDFPAAQTLILEPIGEAGGHEEDEQVELVQLSPLPGSMTWHANASTLGGAQTCHLSVQSFPEKLTSISG